MLFKDLVNKLSNRKKGESVDGNSTRLLKFALAGKNRSFFGGSGRGSSGRGSSGRGGSVRGGSGRGGSGRGGSGRGGSGKGGSVRGGSGSFFDYFDDEEPSPPALKKEIQNDIILKKFYTILLSNNFVETYKYLIDLGHDNIKKIITEYYNNLYEATKKNEVVSYNSMLIIINYFNIIHKNTDNISDESIVKYINYIATYNMNDAYKNDFSRKLDDDAANRLAEEIYKDFIATELLLEREREKRETQKLVEETYSSNSDSILLEPTVMPDGRRRKSRRSRRKHSKKHSDGRKRKSLRSKRRSKKYSDGKKKKSRRSKRRSKKHSDGRKRKSRRSRRKHSKKF